MPLVLAVVVLLAGAAFFFLQSKPAVVAPAGAPATLLVQSNPNGAAVKLDGFPYGVTPVAISPVAAGDHSLEVAGAPKQVITIQPGERRDVTVQISP